MKRLIPGVALAAVLALGCSDGVEIPTVELGGSGGARLMNGQGRTPSEAYTNAYAGLSRGHLNVRRNLENRNQNLYGAREGMLSILRALETMRACVPPAEQVKFKPFLEQYRGWLKSLEDGTWGGSFLDDLDRTEREVKAKLNPAGLEMLAEFQSPARDPAPAPARGPEPSLTPDKVEVPVAKNPPPAEPIRSSAPPVRAKPADPAPVQPAAPPAQAISARTLFKAWSAAHDDLISTYRDHHPCKANYEVVIESLRALKPQLKEDKAVKLQIYIDYYCGIDEKTRSFTVLPDKTGEKDIIDELDVAARVIRKEFNPDR